MKQRHLGVLSAILVILAAALIVWGSWDIFSARKNPEQPNTATVSGQARVVFSDGSGVLVEGETFASGTVLDATKAVAVAKQLSLNVKAYPGMGTLITQIGAKKNGEGGAYWQYWLNGAYATSSADRAAVYAGDKIEWKFSASEQ